ncbi:MAG: glutamine synthetase family protein [Lachnospiraceae bacterium]|nr:glutamine synthetase family protein [Lachnospiraceae bacterium]
MGNYSKADILQLVDDEDVQFIKLQFTDMYGNLKNVAIPATRIITAMDNKCMVDFATIAGFSQTEELPLYFRPDLDTFSILPWRPQQGKVARFICDVLNEDGTEYESNARYILKKVMGKAKEKGYTLLVNPECEFFLFHADENGLPTTLTHEKAGYLDTSPVDLGENTRRDIIMAMEDMGYVIASSHHEIAPAQHEIDFTYENPLATADKIMTFKTAVGTIAKRYGLHATFMPKPRMDENGSGMHIKMRLMKDGKNVFTDETGGLSSDGMAFMSGILKHIQGMTAIFNPLVNSYKRLVPGFEAPSEVTWSRKQRNTLIHVGNMLDGGVELELRSPDSASNPYLVFALCLAAGMDGIDNKLEAPDELVDDIRNLNEYEKRDRGIELLPENLGEAIIAMSNEKLVTDVIGERLAKRYMRAKRTEWKGYLEQVSDWEISKYLYRI